MRQGKIITEHLKPAEARGHYEISCNVSVEKLKEALADLSDITLENKVMYLHISTPANLNQQVILDKLAEEKIKLLYFRNISQSIKTKFYESGEHN